MAYQSPLKKCPSEGKMKRNQLDSPEGSYRGGLLTNFDIERGDKEKKERPRCWGFRTNKPKNTLLGLSCTKNPETLPLCSLVLLDAVQPLPGRYPTVMHYIYSVYIRNPSWLYTYTPEYPLISD